MITKGRFCKKSHNNFLLGVFLFRSKVSEDAGDVKPVRKGRKSAQKPDLSVIPELAVEESTSKVDEKEDIIKEYSSSRR